jgi:hypothetical protein
MKKWEELEAQILGLRKAEKSWDEIEVELNKQKLLRGNGSNLELFTDLKAMEGKNLKELSQREINKVFAKILKRHPDIKPTGIPMRDKVWAEGVHCYRRHLRDFASYLERQGASLDQFAHQEGENGHLQTRSVGEGAKSSDDSFDELLMVKEWAKTVGGLERLKRLCDVLLRLQHD